MKAIYASKLYKRSKRKAAIQAALNNPVNSELVMQLTEYLDEEYQPKEKVDDPDSDFESEGEGKIRPSEHSSGGAGGGGSFGGDFDMDEGGPDLGELTEEVETERAEALEPESAEVEESVRIEGKHPVNSSTAVDSIVDASDEIKGLLNSRSDSTGVVKVAVIDNILHVYFGEDINLNEVMEPAISVLNAAGYSGLSFKKLSRSDNAMTFDIDEVPNPVQPIGHAEE